VRQYCRYILHQRDAQQHVPFSFGRLFQQFLVDTWAVNDQLKLEWLRHNQKKLRSVLYTGVQDWLRDGDEIMLAANDLLPNAIKIGWQLSVFWARLPSSSQLQQTQLA